MTRIVSFVVLLVILLLIFGLFFKVMADFLLPMFLAVLLVVVFGPVHRWFKAKCRNHDRIAAILTTSSILFAFLAPSTMILLRAAQEGNDIYQKYVAQNKLPETQTDMPKTEVVPSLPAEETNTSEAAKNTSNAQNAKELPADALSQWIADQFAKIGDKIDVKFEATDIHKSLREKITQFLTPVAVSTGQFLGRFLLGAFVMIISLYYFLADGPAMIRAIMRLSPLDNEYEEQLINQFDNVTRAVIMASLLSAFVQGLLAGIGFYFAGVGSVFLLTVLSMLFALIPFIGTTGVWIPVCLSLYFRVDASPVAAIVLAIYCAGIVSTIDYVIKPLVLQGKSNMHPLFALLSVLGGMQVLGPIGIIVGPMAVAFLHTLLEMVNREMIVLSGGSNKKLNSETIAKLE